VKPHVNLAESRRGRKAATSRPSLPTRCCANIRTTGISIVSICLLFSARPFFMIRHTFEIRLSQNPQTLMILTFWKMKQKASIINSHSLASHHCMQKRFSSNSHRNAMVSNEKKRSKKLVSASVVALRLGPSTPSSFAGSSCTPRCFHPIVEQSCSRRP
jgi:hypothetical protein